MHKKHFISFLFVLLFCFVCCSSSALGKDLGYKWNQKTIYFNCELPSSQRMAVSQAFVKWNNVRASDGQVMLNLYLALDSVTAPNVIKYSDLDWGVIGLCVPNPTSGNLSSVTILLDSGTSWSTGTSSNSYNLQSVVEHELGHAIGIAHCHELDSSYGEGPCWSATCKSNVMYPRIKPNQVKTTLTDYDISSYRLIYEF